jgi:hypothetical protein
VSASVVWLQGARRLFAVCRFCCVVVRNGAETGMWEPPDSRNEQQEMPVRTRSTRWLAWSLWAMTMALEGAAIWLWLGNRSLGGGYFAPQVFLVPGFATVGALIAARRANRVGWLFVALGLAAALQACSGAYGERVTLVGPGSLPAGSFANGLGGFLWPVNYLLFGLVLLLFPDGRLPSPRWRLAARLIVGSWCLSIIFNMLGPSEEHPGGLLLPQPALQLLTNLVNIAALVGLVVMMAAPFLRFRRASYQQRQQLKRTDLSINSQVKGSTCHSNFAQTVSCGCCRTTSESFRPTSWRSFLDRLASARTKHCLLHLMKALTNRQVPATFGASSSNLSSERQTRST